MPESMLTSQSLSWSGLSSWARRVYESGSPAGTAAFKNSESSTRDSGLVDWRRGPDGAFTITALLLTSWPSLDRANARLDYLPSLSGLDGADGFLRLTLYTLMLETLSPSAQQPLRGIPVRLSH